MTHRQLVFDDFSRKVGTRFALAEEGLRNISLTLAEAEPLRGVWTKPGTRPPFSLVFVANNPLILPQRLYRFAMDDLGEVSIFLVPIGRGADGVRYQALFN